MRFFITIFISLILTGCSKITDKNSSIDILSTSFIKSVCSDDSDIRSLFLKNEDKESLLKLAENQYKDSLLIRTSNSIIELDNDLSSKINDLKNDLSSRGFAFDKIEFKNCKYNISKENGVEIAKNIEIEIEYIGVKEIILIQEMMKSERGWVISSIPISKSAKDKREEIKIQKEKEKLEKENNDKLEKAKLWFDEFIESSKFIFIKQNAGSISSLGGVYGLKVEIINNTGYLIKRGAYRVTYFDPTGRILNRYVKEIEGLEKDDVLIESVPNYNRGVKVGFEVIAFKFRFSDEELEYVNLLKEINYDKYIEFDLDRMNFKN